MLFLLMRSRFGLVLSLAPLLAVCGCGPAALPPPAASDTPAVTVAVVQPERKTLHLAVRQPGSIEAFEQTPMFSKLAGYVEAFHFDIGAHVRKGDVLADLWVPEMVVQLRQKEALVQQAEADVLQARESATAAAASVKSSAARVKEAEAGRLRAEAELKRFKSQHERLTRVGQTGVLDRDAVEETRYALDAALAGVDEVEARVKSAEAMRDETTAKLSKARTDIVVAEAHLQVARADRDEVKTLLQYTHLTAPFDGVVTRRTVDTRHFVQPATGPRAEPLFVVERRDKMRIFVDVPESDAAWVAKDAKARLLVPALQGREFTGEVARTSYALDRTARTLVAEIDLLNPDDQLRPGMYVTATITAETPAVLALPASAIATQGDVTQGYQTFCFLVEGGHAVRTLVQAGRSDGQFTEVLRRQKPGSPPIWLEFTTDDPVALKAAGLTDGQKVQVAEGN